MVNTQILPSNPYLRPPQIISLPLHTSATSSAMPSNASSPDLTVSEASFSSRPTMPSRHSMDSSTSTSTLSSFSSTDSIPRSIPRTISTRSSFDPLSLPAAVPTDFSLPSASIKAKLNRPRAHSHGHSNSYSHGSSALSSSVPRSEPEDQFLHPSYTSHKDKRASYNGNYSALTDSFASLGLQSRTSSPVLRPRACEGLSEEVRREMRMFKD
ncbi:Hypothetical protein D9617_2g059420 [Elsinoe fawcettii]|nr:Hypothetical protein D9617_2g059420 [Elsinoe fawcettii]